MMSKDNAESVRARNIMTRHLNRLFADKGSAHIDSVGNISVSPKGFDIGGKKGKALLQMMAAFNVGMECFAEMSDISMGIVGADTPEELEDKMEKVSDSFRSDKES